MTRVTEGNVDYALFKSKAGFISRLPEAGKYTERDLCVPELRLEAFDDVSIYYVPFDFVNRAAKLILVGITPGFRQFEKSIQVARYGVASVLRPPRSTAKLRPLAFVRAA